MGAISDSSPRSWWRATSFTGLSDGATCPDWVDSSGNGWTALPNYPTIYRAANTPTGLPSVEFGSGSSGAYGGWAGVGLASSPPAVTHAMVFKASSGVYQTLISGGDSGAPAMRLNPSNKFEIGLNGVAFTEVGAAVDTSSWHVVVWRLNTSTGAYTINLDGAVHASGTISMAGLQARFLWFGKDHIGSTDYYPIVGHVASYVTWASVLSDTTVADVTAELTTTWIGSSSGLAVTSPTAAASAAAAPAAAAFGEISLTSPTASATAAALPASVLQDVALTSPTAAASAAANPATVTFGAIALTSPTASATGAALPASAVTATGIDLESPTAAAFAATQPAMVSGGDPQAWAADYTGRALVGVNTSETDLYVPPPIADPPPGVTPAVITAFPQVIAPADAANPVRELVYPTEAVVGVPHVWVDGIDRTYSLDGELASLDDLVSEAGYGDRTAKLTVNGFEMWHRTGEGDFDWLHRGARVEAGVVDPDTGTRHVWWSGDLVSTSLSSRGTSFTRTYDVTGPSLALARSKHQPPDRMDPTDVGIVWARNRNTIPSRRYPKVKPVRTGITTRKRGSFGQSRAEYEREFLATAWAGGRPWRPRKSATNPRLYELVLIDTTTTHWTVTAGAHGVDLDVTEDWTSVPNRIFGRGTLPRGHRWFNRKWPFFLPYDPPPYPFSNTSQQLFVGMSDADTDTGNGASVVEKRLVELGYSVPIDGVYSADDEDVIRVFQRDRGLQVDGIIAGQTWTGLWAVGYTGADLRSVRLPLASDPRVEKWLYLPNGAKAGLNPDYDPAWPVVEEDIDYGENTTLALGIRDAQQRIDRFALTTPLIGTLTLTGTDPREGSRFHIDETENITVLGVEGRDVLFHIADRKIDRSNGSVTLTIDSAFRDSLTIREILRRNSESAPDPARRPGVIGKTRATSSPNITNPFDGASPAGKLPETPLFSNLWSVFPVPMSESDILAHVTTRTWSSACRHGLLIFATEVLPAELKHNLGNILTTDRPWADGARAAWLKSKGFVTGWGQQGEALGFGTGQESQNDPLTGASEIFCSVPYYAPKSILWVAMIASTSCRISVDLDPQANG